MSDFELWSFMYAGTSLGWGSPTGARIRSAPGETALPSSREFCSRNLAPKRMGMLLPHTHTLSLLWCLCWPAVPSPPDPRPRLILAPATTHARACAHIRPPSLVWSQAATANPRGRSGAKCHRPYAHARAHGVWWRDDPWVVHPWSGEDGGHVPPRGPCDPPQIGPRPVRLFLKASAILAHRCE